MRSEDLDNARLKVDVFPFELKDLAASHSRIHAEQDYRFQMRIVCLYIGLEYFPFTFVLDGTGSAARPKQPHFFGIRKRPRSGRFGVRVYRLRAFGYILGNQSRVVSFDQ
jgi:hypothetical protein